MKHRIKTVQSGKDILYQPQFRYCGFWNNFFIPGTEEGWDIMMRASVYNFPDRAGAIAFLHTKGVTDIT